VILTSGLIVSAWGYFLVQGVRDPLGGINSLWPLFGIANQLLAAIALCLATTILLKTHGLKYVWITCLPLIWLVTVTFTAGAQKLFSRAPAIGFWAQAGKLSAALRSSPVVEATSTRALIFNARLDAVLCAALLLLVAAILLDSLRAWTGLLRHTRESRLSESPFVASQLRAGEL
jgi:carbon starvation protein